MNANEDRTFQPRLELLEDRFLAANVFPLAPFALTLPAAGARSATSIPTIVNMFGRPTAFVSPVPTHINIGGVAQTSGFIITTNLDGGFTAAGLPTTSRIGTGPGLTTPGLPSSPPSHPVTQSTGLPGGLTLNPNGTVSGTLSGMSPITRVGTSVAVVPTHISLGLFDQVTPTTVANKADPGLTTRGLISPAVLGF
jgi:hypothetical protein